ncbi:MAG: ABC transporter substrate-binding protein [Atopobiaceae bacterium]|nr:ABC transporter substrate-binding protein [Atopobiaceae bacterium]
MNTNLTRRSFVAAQAAAASLALAACGGSNQSSSDADASADLTKITFCLDYTPNTNHTGIYVAQQKGFFADEGLEVEIVQPAEDTAEAMIGTGQAQLGISYQDYIANALVGGNTGLQAVAAVIQHNTSGIMSRQEDGVTTAKGMEGKRYATWEMPVEQATIKHIVEKDGGDYSKVQLVPYTVDDEISGLKANMFDTVWVYEGWAVQNATVQSYPVNYFSFISIDDVFDYYTPVIAANNDFCDKNPDVVKAFLRAAKKGYEFAISDPDGAADILCEAVPELDPALVKQSASFLAGEYQSDAASWGLIEADRWAAFYQWLNDNNLVEKPIDVNSGWTMDYLEA